LNIAIYKISVKDQKFNKHYKYCDAGKITQVHKKEKIRASRNLECESEYTTVQWWWAPWEMI